MTAASRRTATRRAATTLLATTGLLVGLAGTAGAAGAASGLPRGEDGVRPGPPLLYSRAVTAPQLQNRGPFRAKPILVSGAEAYRRGEWMYQDWLQDDHGARGVPDPTTPYDTGSHTFSPAFGSYTYPTDPAFRANGADLVELRVKPLAGATAFRVTLNTLRDPARTAFTIALGGAPGTNVAWPDGAGVSSPADLFVTWHGDEVTYDATDGSAVATSAPTGLRVDRVRNQVTIVVPHAVFDPGTSTVRTTVGTGLWDVAADSYLAPSTGSATATTPGGGTPQGVAIVNVGPRPDEPLPLIAGATIADTAAGAAATSAFWRERQQGLQLALGDVSPFFADIDFGKLRRGVTDDTAVPTSGPIDRILSSRFSFGEGLDPSTVCFSLTNGALVTGADVGPPKDCTGSVTGPLQSYAVYVPAGRAPAAGWGLTLMPHSLSANYNQYLGTTNQAEIGDRATGSVVVTPGGRGPDGFSSGAAEADLFETWADVARHYPLDPTWTAVTGYSMGGFSTYRMLARWPDLFGRGFSVVGAPGTVGDQLASLRNSELMNWNSGADELVNVQTQRDAVAALEAAGVRFTQWTFPAADHLTLAANDEYGPGADFLGHALVPRDPKHVTFVVDPREDTRFGGVRADHAWWLSGLRVADASTTGTIDARSLATTQGDAPVLPVAQGAGVLTGGQEPLPYVTETQAWGPPATQRARDVLVLTLANVGRATIDLRRAGLTCGARIEATTDTDAVVRLAGCGRMLRLTAG